MRNVLCSPVGYNFRAGIMQHSPWRSPARIAAENAKNAALVRKRTIAMACLGKPELLGVVMGYLAPCDIFKLRRVCKNFDATIQLSDAQVGILARVEPKRKSKLYQLLIPEHNTFDSYWPRS